MSSPHRLVVDFTSGREAARAAKALLTFLAKHAQQADAALAKKDSEWPGSPTKAEVAYGASHGVRWTEALVWGESMSGQPVIKVTS